MDGREKLDEARRMLGNFDPHGRAPTAHDAMAALGLLADAMAELPDWVWGPRCCPPGESCCNCD